MNAKSGHETGRDAVLTHGVVSEHPEGLLHGTGWRVPWAVMQEAGLRLWSDDAFGLAGNVAFRALLAIFPFLIFTSSMTAFIGDRSMADELIAFLIAIVPPPLVEPIVSEVEQVMTVQRGGVLSIGILLTIWFAVGGVDGVRVGLNRAYGIHETRSTVALYGLQTAMVVLASLALVLVGYLLVLAPRAGSWLHTLLPGFEPASVTVGLIRYPAAAVILIAALFAAHVFLPARRTRILQYLAGRALHRVRVGPACGSLLVLLAEFRQLRELLRGFGRYHSRPLLHVPSGSGPDLRRRTQPCHKDPSPCACPERSRWRGARPIQIVSSPSAAR